MLVCPVWFWASRMHAQRFWRNWQKLGTIDILYTHTHTHVQVHTHRCIYASLNHLRVDQGFIGVILCTSYLGNAMQCACGCTFHTSIMIVCNILVNVLLILCRRHSILETMSMPFLTNKRQRRLAASFILMIVHIRFLFWTRSFISCCVFSA